ncbi:MAG TPA: GAF domain-containing protein [Thermoflexia bacterium]|nr:GAF domain-containing protein [Thermoflexia bacterium]
MIIRFLRRFSVRQRILTGVAILVLVIAFALTLMVNQYSSENAFLHLADVDSQVDRLLLGSAAQIASSRMNLLRYTEDLVPSPYESLDELGQARDSLLRAQELAAEKSQKAEINVVLRALADYEVAIHDIEKRRQSAPGVSTAGLEHDAQRLSRDTGTRIALIVAASEQRVANMRVERQVISQRRLWGLLGFYSLLGGSIVIFAFLVEWSITRPIIELRKGAEAFGRGELEMQLPVAATAQDELSALTHSFNQMASQLAHSYRLLEERVATRTQELEERSMHLEAAAKVARNTASIRDVGTLLSTSVQLISEQFGFYHAGIFLLDEQGESLFLKAASSEGGQRMLARQHKLRVGQGIVGSVALHREPRIALDVGADVDFFDNPDLPETHSEMGLPLLVQGEVLGVLDVQSKQRDAFSDKDVNVLQTMADQLALAIENARLLRSSQAALQNLERLYGEQSHAAWWAQLHARSFVYHYAGVDVVAEDERPLPAASATRNLKLDISSRGLRLGTLLLQRDADALDWTAEERATVRATVAQLGPVLEAARLFEDTQRRAHRESTIREISDKMGASFDLETVLRTTVEELSVALGAGGALVELGLPQEEQ